MPNLHDSTAAVESTIRREPGVRRTDVRFQNERRLTPERVDEIKGRFRSGESAETVAEVYGLDLPTARRFERLSRD